MMLDFAQIHLPEFDQPMTTLVQKKLDAIVKPLDSLGTFEPVIAQIGAIQHTTDIKVDKKALVIMCADNGIVAEGISQSGQEVTRIVATSMGRHASPVCAMANQAGVDIFPIDIGMVQGEPIFGVESRNVASGTKNFAHEPAMTESQMQQAISVGIEKVKQLKDAGYQLIATGEMGIGNTTTSTAVACALLELNAAQVTGRGAGLDDVAFIKKKQVIEQAIAQYELREATPQKVLQTVGGFDIAGLVGIYLGGAMYELPIVCDGAISLTAALLAERICPGCKRTMIASHKSKEPIAQAICTELALLPVIDANMALGEGTGAVMMCALLDLALSVYRTSPTFVGVEMQPYERYDS